MSMPGLRGMGKLNLMELRKTCFTGMRKPEPALFSGGISEWLYWPLNDVDIQWDVTMTDTNEYPDIEA